MRIIRSAAFIAGILACASISHGGSDSVYRSMNVSVDRVGEHFMPEDFSLELDKTRSYGWHARPSSRFSSYSCLSPVTKDRFTAGICVRKSDDGSRFDQVVSFVHASGSPNAPGIEGLVNKQDIKMSYYDNGLDGYGDGDVVRIKLDTDDSLPRSEYTHGIVGGRFYQSWDSQVCDVYPDLSRFTNHYNAFWTWWIKMAVRRKVVSDDYSKMLKSLGSQDSTSKLEELENHLRDRFKVRFEDYDKNRNDSPSIIEYGTRCSQP